jgi:hopanoid biosynthesis associated RND transporter like protein HpnN
LPIPLKDYLLPKKDWFNGTCLALVRGLRWCAWPILLGCFLVAALAVYYTVNHLAIRTTRKDLVASDKRLIARTDEFDREFGFHDNLIVVVENTEERRSIAFAETLAAELRRYPDQFAELFYRVNPEPFKQWALLYLKPAELLELKEKLAAHRREMAALAADFRLSGFFQVVNEEITRALIGELFTSFLEEEKEKEKLPDLSLLNATLQELALQLEEGPKPYVSPLKSLIPGDLGDLSEEGYFFTENDKFLLFLITAREGDFTTKIQILKHLRQIVDQVKARFPGLNVGVTGTDALEEDEMASALRDITLATWLSIFSQMVLFIIFLRSFKRTLVEGLALLIGLCWTFGVATLVVGHLNLLSVIFVPLMLGLTIDYGIHWFSRLEEEQGRRKRCTAGDLTCTLRRASPGIIYAAVAAAVSFLPLAFTGFKGLAELGLILTLGVLLMVLATLLTLPSSVILTERCQPGPIDEECAGHPRPFLALRWRRPALVVGLGFGIIALGGLCLFKVPFDLNPLHLQNPHTESVVWELKLLKGARYSTSYGVMTADSLSALKAKREALKKLASVSSVESILSFLPSEVEAKRPLLQELQPIVAPVHFPAALPSPSRPQELAAVLGRIHFKLAQAQEDLEGPESKETLEQVKEANHYLSQVIPLLNPARHPQSVARLAAFERRFLLDLKDKWDLIKANVTNPAPLTIEGLPADVRVRFISSRGNYLLQIFPSQDIWNPQALGKFVRDLRRVDPQAMGDPVLLYFFTFAFRNACLWAAGMALLAVQIMLLLLFRSLKMAALALIPLWVGTGLTLVMMWLLDIRFNQANVLFLPLILGEGVEFGIIILVRWQLEEPARAITLPASTAKGVLLAALTTTVGFGSLMISGHRGTFSLGLLATVGSLSVLLASLSVLPAFLRLLERRPTAPEPSLRPVLALRRGFWQLVRKEPS